ncbi:conjugal transfer protein TraG N-terminal domain-containing protein [Pseudomonas oryzihabitans]|uniref:conjugal transfer protein TraG N-terminal domain-containing protein n=1 Tax=Pseudomonas oryzihabitans TaxID=47885 RepID=UPI00214DF7AA|nr:conjugal transfer protein TraG N-terminal domain-containing protein [Pseudomonas psychrotolerans]UUW74342.1 conjugal transfer protein TraG N-terminal domain-containing protein [Pseudomonas psychrotolerans]
MEFSIYSIGSATYLESILNAVAMISGSGSIESLAKVGLLIGTLFLGFQAVFKNQAIPFQQVGVALILYMALYGPTGRAVVEDVYDGTVVVVDNVPIGPLFVGSVVSNIGYKLTREMEQAFSTPAMTTYGFADPLTTLMKVRGATRNVLAMPSVMGDSNAGGDFVRSWTNYIKECTLVGVGRNMTAYGALMRSNSPIDAMRFDSEVYGTEIYEGKTGTGTYYNCSQAHTRLKALSVSAQPGVMDDVSKLAFQKPGKVVTGDDLTTRVDDALRGLNLQVADARAFTMASILLPIFERAPAQKALEDQQSAYAIMLAQAQAQQATQWAAEGSMFTRYVRPFLTFFEGLIYAITPLMAFLLVMGTFGMNLITKYITMLCWMMLWQPMLAIVNLYTNWYTGTVMEGLLATTSTVTDGNALSFEMLKQMLPALDSAIGVAGLMASSVPVISMFLVSGSAFALTSMAQRLGGTDQINEKIVTPDVVKPTEGLATTPYMTNDFVNGTRQTGSETTRGSINIGQSLSNAAQSQKATAESASENFAKSLTSSYGRQMEQAKTLGEQATVGSSFANSFGLTNNASYEKAVGNMRNMGYSQAQTDAVVASLATGGNVSAGLGLGKYGAATGEDGKSKGGVELGGSANIGANMQSSSTRNDSKTASDVMNDARSAGLSEVVSNALRKENSSSVAQNFQNSEKLGVSQADQQSLSKSAQEAISAQKQYSETSSYLQSTGMQLSMSPDAWAGKLQREGKADAVVAEAMNNYGQEFQEAKRMFDTVDPSRRDTAAALHTLAKHNDLGVLTGGTVDRDMYSNPRSGGELGASPTSLAHNEFQGLKGPQVGDLRSETQSAGHSVSSGSFESRYDAGNAAARDHSKIAAEHARRGEIVAGDGQVYANRAVAEAGERAEGRLADKGKRVNDMGESVLGGIPQKAMNRMGSVFNAGGTHADYVNEGKRLHLNDSQAEVFAAARMGTVDNNTWGIYRDSAIKNGYGEDVARGSFDNLVQAGLYDNGSGATLADVVTLNQRDDHGESFKLR